MPKKKRFEVKVTVSLPEELAAWLDEGVRRGFFANVSHGIRKCVAFMRESFHDFKIKPEEERRES